MELFDVYKWGAKSSTDGWMNEWIKMQKRELLVDTDTLHLSANTVLLHLHRPVVNKICFLRTQRTIIINDDESKINDYSIIK